MKTKNLFVVFIAMFLIIALIVLGVIFFFSSDSNVIDNVFECLSFDDVETYVSQKNITHEKHDNSIHLFNVSEFGQVGYCIIETETDSKKIIRIDFYMTFENDGELEKNIESVKESFLKKFGFEGDYEYFPLESTSDDVGEKEFLNQTASKELFVYEEDSTWNISWYITNDGVSARMSKSIFN